MKKLLLLSVFALLAVGCQKVLAPGPVACTQEAKLCPNGSYVGRTGPACEFAPCPGEEATTSIQPPLFQINSGIEGTVTTSPTCPVETIPPTPGCEPKPYQTTFQVWTPDHKTTVAEFTSSINGLYKIKLEPGIYILAPKNTGGLPHGEPQTVEVTQNTYTKADFSFDSGIR